MSDTKFVRSLLIGIPGSGHEDLTVDVNEGTNGLMPIRIVRKDDVVHLRWSEWDEVRDHVEYCATMMKPETTTAEVGPTHTSVPWVMCEATNPSMGESVRYQSPWRCVLVDGHSTGTDHVDSTGRRFRTID